MRLITLIVAACLCAMLATTAPAFAASGDPSGNTATNSTGVVQVGSVNVDPTATVATSAGTATFTAPSGSTAPSRSGSNKASGSTGAVQTSPTSVSPGVTTSHRRSSVNASTPVAIGSGDNRAAGSTGAAQIGGGNEASSSTGAAQVGGTGIAPSASATPAGSGTTTFGVEAGVDGSGNSTTGSTGTAQIGGGNSATGSLGSAQSTGPQVVPTLDTTAPSPFDGLLQPFSLSSSPTPAAAGATDGALASVSEAQAPESPRRQAVTSQDRPAQSHLGVQGRSRTGAMGEGDVSPSLAARIVTGALPFTGLALLAWILAAVVSVVVGTALRRRGARLA
jgi:hypothetical protein